MYQDWREDHRRAAALLQGAGLRLTPQRMAIVREVLTHNHPTATEVFEAVQDQFPTMGLATVYATLNTMVERGLLRPVAFADAIRFETNLEPHANLICTRCGQIADFEGCDDLLRLLVDRTRTAVGFALEQQRLDLYGRCATCKSQPAEPAPNTEASI